MGMEVVTEPDSAVHSAWPSERRRCLRGRRSATGLGRQVSGRRRRGFRRRLHTWLGTRLSAGNGTGHSVLIAEWSASFERQLPLSDVPGIYAYLRAPRQAVGVEAESVVLPITKAAEGVALSPPVALGTDGAALMDAPVFRRGQGAALLLPTLRIWVVHVLRSTLHTAIVEGVLAIGEQSVQRQAEKLATLSTRSSVGHRDGGTPIASATQGFTAFGVAALQGGADGAGL
eukprot:scaffold3828_cov267-Pinguiococcus_pyrenoidosus.AAC.2